MAITNKALTALKTRVEDLNKQIREESKVLLNDEFVKVFEKYPKLKSFSWSQYTPYFNDGDECVFSVNSDSLIPDFTDESAEDHDYEYEKKDIEYVTIKGKWQTRKLEVPDWKAENNKAYDEIQDIVNAINDDTLKAIYGDHVKVIISKKADGSLKVKTDDHDHD